MKYTIDLSKYVILFFIAYLRYKSAKTDDCFTSCRYQLISSSSFHVYKAPQKNYKILNL